MEIFMGFHSHIELIMVVTSHDLSSILDGYQKQESHNLKDLNKLVV